MDGYQVSLDLNTKLLLINISLTVSLFIISTIIAVAIFVYKMKLIIKLHKDFVHTKERKAQAIVLLRQRKVELNESKRFNGK